MSIVLSRVSRHSARLAPVAALVGLLGACAQPGAEGPRPAWVSDLDQRYASAMAAEGGGAGGAARRGAAAAGDAATAAPGGRAVLSFSVESPIDAPTFASRLHLVAQRCWVSDDASYRAALESPTVVTLTFEEKTQGAAPVEALRLVARARPDGGQGLTVDAVGPLAADSHRRVIERGLRQASADLSACL